ncbi:MAG: hypothetical protein AAF740_08055 [Bacteroidota bacterium]
MLISACQGVDRAASLELTDENVQNYIKAYKALRKQVPEILEGLNQNPEATINPQAQFGQIENIIQESGLQDYPEFVVLNAKIGAVFSIIKATEGMEKFQNLQDSGNEMFSDSRSEIQKLLNDPSIPEETKAELRATLEELDANQQTMNQAYSENRVWAEVVLETVTQLTDYIVSEADIEMVKKY